MASFPEVVVGNRVSVQTVFGDEYKGDIFAFEPKSRILILHENREHTVLKKNVRMINEKSITGVTLLKEGTDCTVDVLPPHDLKVSQERYDVALEEARNADSKVRDGVPEQVQLLFDTLAKQYNCVWRETSNMIHMPDLQLVISAPYTPDKCEGKDPVAVAHLKRVLTGIRSKLGM